MVAPYIHTEHVFMSKEEAEMMADYKGIQTGKKCKAIRIYDHPGSWAVLLYDRGNRPDEVMLLSDETVVE